MPKGFIPQGDLGPGRSSIAAPPCDLGCWTKDSSYPEVVRTKFAKDFLDGPFDPHDTSYVYDPPKPEQASDLPRTVEPSANDEQAALQDGVWQTDASAHARSKAVDPEKVRGGTTVLEPQPGQRTLRIAYFLSLIHI